MKADVVTGYSTTFLITTDTFNQPITHDFILVRKELYDLIYLEVEIIQQFIYNMINTKDNHGNSLYWENDYHSKLVQRFASMFGDKKSDISNALSAVMTSLGYYK